MLFVLSICLPHTLIKRTNGLGKKKKRCEPKQSRRTQQTKPKPKSIKNFKNKFQQQQQWGVLCIFPHIVVGIVIYASEFCVIAKQTLPIKREPSFNHIPPYSSLNKKNKNKNTKWAAFKGRSRRATTTTASLATNWVSRQALLLPTFPPPQSGFAGKLGKLLSYDTMLYIGRGLTARGRGWSRQTFYLYPMISAPFSLCSSDRKGLYYNGSWSTIESYKIFLYCTLGS